MGLFKTLWTDEAGALLSAEAAIVGTVAVVGVGAGMNVVATSVNEELKELGYAIRSLDQSYTIPEQKGCGAWTAGSSFQQQPVKESLAELKQVEKRAEAKARKQSERLQKRVERQRKKKQAEQEPAAPAEAI